MSLPKITDTITGYTYEWADEQVKIEVSRIRTHSSGRVSGEIHVTTTTPGVPPHLHQAEFTFTASQSRRTLAKTLEARYNTVDWYSILEQLAVYTLEKVRRGELVQELWTGNGILPPRFLLEPLIIEHYPNVIFGDPGAMKSTIAVCLIQVMMLPWNDNPMGLVAPKEIVNCLYLDWETDKETLIWQAEMLKRGMPDMPELRLLYRKCSMPLAQDMEQIQKHIADTESQVIIIDSLGLAAGGELKDTTPTLAFYAAFRQLNVAGLILAHNSKDRESKTRTIYGNQFFTAQARNIWEIRKNQEPGSTEADIVLFHRKPPPFNKLHKPLGFKVVFDSEIDSMSIYPQDPKTVGEFLEQMGTQDRILEFLQDGQKTKTEIKETLQLSDGNTRVALKRLRDKNLIIKLGEDSWGLAYRGEE